MKIAVAHYHLRRGGVTRVIESAVAALAESGHEVLVLSGEEPAPGIRLPYVRVIESLGYTGSDARPDALRLARELVAGASAHFGQAPGLWHFHNHALGKNVAVPGAVREIAGSAPVLLQVHDFAEDGRPENFKRQLAFDSSAPLWPQAPQIHYAAINQRDYHNLSGAGVEESRLHLLPNAITEIKTAAVPADRPFARGKTFYLYPTRAIRRKNIGELLLHAHFHQDDAYFATTLVPENPEWLKIHRHWEDVAARLKLPISLGGHAHAFADMVGWADALITTSIAEGFGLAFLEPCLAGKPVVGRDLPEVTSDFPIDFGGFYGRFDIPIDRISLTELKSELERALRKSYGAYGREMPPHAVQTALESMVIDGRIDFGRLSEPFQTAVLENPLGIEPPAIAPCPIERVREQAGVVRDSCGVNAYGVRLDTLYRDVAGSGMGDVSDPGTDVLLDAFLDPARFNLLRT